MSEVERVKQVIDKFLSLAEEVTEEKNGFADGFRLGLADMYTVIDMARLIKDKELVSARTQLQEASDDAE